MAIDSDRLKELGERTLRCTVSHDWAGLREQYADDAVWHTPNAPLLSDN